MSPHSAPCRISLLARTLNTLLLLVMLLVLLLVMIAAQPHDDEFRERDAIGEMHLFAAGPFMIGSHETDLQFTGEYPVRVSQTRAFLIDRYPVTNRQFGEFVKEARYYSTTADRKKFSYVLFSRRAADAEEYTEHARTHEPWWSPVMHARWSRLFSGNWMNMSGFAEHPVVHVSWEDADAFCKFYDKRLPTEPEWEKAARGNNASWKFPWGQSMRRNRMNVWQGMFPIQDNGYDGWPTGTSPVNHYPAQNEHGMYDMVGNVWEWTDSYYFGKDRGGAGVGLGGGSGGESGARWMNLTSDYAKSDSDDGSNDAWMTLKGGSFVDTLDGEAGTRPVRTSVKMGRHYEYTAGNVGFRCAADYMSEEERDLSAWEKSMEEDVQGHTREELHTETKARVIKYSDTYEFRRMVEQLHVSFRQLKRKKSEQNSRIHQRYLEIWQKHTF